MPSQVRTARSLLFLQIGFMALFGALYLWFGQALFGFGALAAGVALWWVTHRLAGASLPALILVVIAEAVICTGYAALSLRASEFLFSPLVALPPIVIFFLIRSRAWFESHVE